MGVYGVLMLAAAGMFWSAYTLGHWQGWKKGYGACHEVMMSPEARAAHVDAIVRLLKKRGVAVESGTVVLKDGGQRYGFYDGERHLTEAEIEKEGAGDDEGN